MLKKANIWIVLFFLVFAGLVYGISELFRLRFEGGDVYPPYSSLRSDPLGTKALYESLDQLPGISVRRFYEQFFKVKDGRNTTFFVLGVGNRLLDWTSETEANDLDTFVKQGGRLVVTFFPENAEGWSARRDKKKQKNSSAAPPQDVKYETRASDSESPEPKKKEMKQRNGDDEFSGKMISLKKRWDFKVDYEDLPVDEKGISQAVEVERASDIVSLPQQISWHSAIYFTDLYDDWKPIYKRGTNSVIIERTFGRGSIVLVSDSYFLSNEALRKDPQAALLAWVAGSNSQFIFDEAHLGVSEDPGIATLARKYRLHGLVGGLLLLAILFVWKNSISFIPAHPESIDTHDLMAGKDSATGFVNLLRRNVSAADLLSICFSEWKKSGGENRCHTRSKVKRVAKVVAEQNALPARQKNPAESYQSISKILAERK